MSVNKGTLKELFEETIKELNEAGYDVKYDTFTREVMFPEYPGIKLTLTIGSIFNEMVFPEEGEIN